MYLQTIYVFMKQSYLSAIQLKSCMQNILYLKVTINNRTSDLSNEAKQLTTFTVSTSGKTGSLIRMVVYQRMKH